MSEVAQKEGTEGTENGEQGTPVDPFSLITDSRIVVKDTAERDGLVSYVKEVARKARAALVSEENTTKLLAWVESFMSSYCIANNGFVDWGGKSQSYIALVVNTRNEALQGMTDAQARKLRQNVRAAKGRGGASAPILLAIVRYVLTTNDEFAETAKSLKDWKDGLKDLVLAEQAKNPSDRLVQLVNQQYRDATGAGDPPKGTAFRKAWDGDPEADGTGSIVDAGRSDQETAGKKINAAVLAVPQVTPITTVIAIRDMLRGLIAQTMAEGFTFQDGSRAKCQAVLAETVPAFLLYGKALAGTTTESEMRRLLAFASEGVEQGKKPNAEADAEADGAKDDAEAELADAEQETAAK